MSESIAPWTPLGASEDELEEFLSLREGLPDYLYESLIKWVRARKAGQQGWVHWDFLVDFQTASRTSLGVAAGMYTQFDDLADFLRTLEPEPFANLLDYMLATSDLYNTDALKHLEKVLATGGSSWRVGIRGGRNGLVARMPSSVVDVVASVTSASDRAGGKLAEAWDKAYGPDSQPSDAYVAAVRAVEILICPLVSPKSDRATLGTVIRDLRNQSSSWRFVMKHGDGTDTTEEVVALLQLLWKAQNDRHGSGSYADVTVEEAQAAVLLSSTLVGWLAKGMLKREQPSK